MTREDVRKRLRAAEETISQMAQEWERTGELRHLHGQPLDLSDDSPEWFANRMLKNQGFSHPLIERGKDLDNLRRDTENILERLRWRRERMEELGPRLTPERIRQFNRARTRALQEYRAALERFNSAGLGYNLTMPESLHKRLLNVDRAVAEAADEIPSLPETLPEPEPLPTFTFELPARLRRLWRRQ